MWEKYRLVYSCQNSGHDPARLPCALLSNDLMSLKINWRMFMELPLVHRILTDANQNYFLFQKI